MLLHHHCRPKLQKFLHDKKMHGAVADERIFNLFLIYIRVTPHHI